ncbi:MAG: methyltransferase [Syntrophaceae bacterium]
MYHNYKEHGPFRFDHYCDLALLRRVLENNCFVQSALSEATASGNPANPLVSFVELAADLRRTSKSSPFNTLVRLFVLAQTVSEDSAQEALAPIELDQLVSFGLLKRSSTGIRSVAALLPFEGLLLAYDMPVLTSKPCLHDHVLGVGPASLFLANLTVRKKVETVLDLGTGQGFQALLAARHADHVIATDTNLRALNFTMFNARLNDMSNIELRQGSLYDPVAGHNFDLIISNPPFVISPQFQYEYRDSGMPGDAISEQVIRGAAGMLCEGGFCTVIFNWHHQDEEDWDERPRQWMIKSGCDAWIICSGTEDTITYASSWLRYEDNLEAHQRLLDEWMAYYERLGIGKISFGAIVLRRRSGHSNWIRADKVPTGQLSGSCSDQIQRIFVAQDLIEELRDEADFLKKSFRLIPDHQLEHVLQLENGNWAVKKALLKQTRGFQFIGDIDSLVGTMVAGCDGQRSVGELLNDLAAGLGLASEKIAPDCIRVIRKLFETGFIVEC